MSTEDDAGQGCSPKHCLADNPLLVALAQNGALRLTCHAADISLLDDSTLCVVAGATRSTGLFENKENKERALFRERGSTCSSITLFNQPTGHETVTTQDLIADTTRLVVRDMRALDQYKDCSHVVAPPHIVSFAEVPIRNSSGHLLGTYCLMDDKVRQDFFDDETIHVLTDIANVISSFLDLHNSATSSNMCHTNRLPDQTYQLPPPPPSDSSPAGQYTHNPFTPQSEASDFSFPSHAPDPSASDPYNPNSDRHAHEPRHVFSKAARQICAAVNFEGLAFLDNSANKASLESPSFCEVLGSFVAPKACNLEHLHEASLNYLTRQYPRGCTLSASAQTIIVVGDGDASTIQAASSQPTDVTSQLPPDLKSLVYKARSLIFLPLWDSSLQRFYVGMMGWSQDPKRVFAGQDLACLAAFGKSFMMELGRSGTYTALCFQYSTDCSVAEALDMEGTKFDFVSSISHELRSPLHGCLAALEFLRDTKIDDIQSELIEMIQACASTLLDTLNHLLDFSKVNELRSAKSRAQKPLSNVRLKHSQNTFGSTSEQYLCTILQDVVEGVHFGQSSQQAAYMRAKTTPINNLAFSTHPGLLLDSAGDEYNFLTTKAADTVAVYLDVQNQSEWCTTLPAGAWKRLVMNLFANALKFTTEGFVEVSLKMVEDEQQVDKNTRFVRLMINDTGSGMSEEYMKLHLYQAFVQENQLVSGVGLGLSIVKQIVDDLGGTINVESKQGCGTMFDIMVPLCEQDAQCLDSIPSGGEILDPDAALKGLTICLLWPSDLQPPHTSLHSRRISVMHSYVRSIAKGWFGMKIVTGSATAQVNADVYIAEASQFSEQDIKCLKSSRRPTIAVGPCLAAKAGKNGPWNDIIKLAYPLGPKSLGRALFAALENPIEPDHPHEAIDLEPSHAFEEKLMRKLEGINLDHRPDKPSNRVEESQVTDTIMAEHILLVDDNAINLKLLAAYVKKLGFSAELAVDGQDAYQKYQAASRSKPFTTILMDISMPIMNGFESSRAIRDYEAVNSISPPATIIALTGLGSDSSRKEAELSGMNDFRTKPMALKTLKALLTS